MDKEVLQKAIDTYGINAQLDMCIEEMSELTKAICKYKRIYSTVGNVMTADIYDNVCEETADVLIMIEQMQMMFDSHNIEQQAEHKVKRLAERLGMSDED